jgi:phage shock protein PspC (stress-responsive transcriptional regulator)
MKKVMTVHLNNRVFQMEEDAYDYLRGTLETQWQKSELEARVAESLEQKESRVITFPDVVDTLYRLGLSTTDARAGVSGKKLYRQPAGGMIAGVCSGLGTYFDVDPVLVRVLFLIAFFFGTMGFWLYLALWIITPKANLLP